jgi:hypothetical protein
MDIALLKLMLMKHSIHHLWKFCENWRMGFGGGNPYNLTSTVTAGIVSAKARDQQAEFNLYSNRRSGKPRKQRRRSGKYAGFIGINTMISSMTGSYVGYSFCTV